MSKKGNGPYVQWKKGVNIQSKNLADLLAQDHSSDLNRDPLPIPTVDVKNAATPNVSEINPADAAKMQWDGHTAKD